MIRLLTENLRQTESRFADLNERLFQQHRPKVDVRACSREAIMILQTDYLDGQSRQPLDIKRTNK
jgi:hypothetical protein